MMIVVAHLKVSGAFRALGALAIEHAHAPFVLLVSGDSARRRAVGLSRQRCDLPCDGADRRAGDPRARPQPAPYLVATATASNCGSVATITGNPQNMVIGAMSGISYPAFAARARAGRCLRPRRVVVVVLARLSPRNSQSRATQPASRSRGRCSAGRSSRRASSASRSPSPSSPASAGQSGAVGGAILLFTRSIKPMRIYREIDGPLLILFAGLFIVVAGAERALLTPDRIAMAKSFGLDVPWRLSAVHRGSLQHRQQRAGGAGARPFIPSFPDPERAWLVVAMSSTLAGNFTLLGSVANLIVAEQARARRGADQLLGLFQGRPAADAADLAAGTAWLAWR